jgi:hypothetical protein
MDAAVKAATAAPPAGVNTTKPKSMFDEFVRHIQEQVTLKPEPLTAHI